MTFSRPDVQDPLPIPPICRPLRGILPLPGSKSITNRALMLAALADGTTTLEGALFSRDTRIMVEALQKLGFEVEPDEENHRILVQGQGGRIPIASANLHVGNAGTAARFLTALLALHPNGTFHLDGDEAMRDRPMDGLLHALTALGTAEFSHQARTGYFPFTMTTSGAQGGESKVDARASSQILSALLLAMPSGTAPTTLHCGEVRPAYIAITQRVRESFGAAPMDPSSGVYSLDPLVYRSPESGSYAIEPDLSAASYFLALTLVHGGSLTLPHLSPDPIQGDAAFAGVLKEHGLEVAPSEGNWILSRSREDITQGPREHSFQHFSDTFLTYAAIAPLLGESVKLSGIGHTRHQETDRIAGMATELAKLGQGVEEEPDALTIIPDLAAMRLRALQARGKGALLEIATYDDHRFAMSFGILGTHDLLGDGQPWLAIKDPSCCGKTFPAFFDRLFELGR